jgi:alkylation response protein AidB-like acyl-CoA dehydrogenase
VIGTNPGLEELAEAFQSYLDENREDHTRFKHMPTDFNERVPILCDLQRALYDAGWARYGWPEEAGGLGGTAVHRALIVDLLQRNGYPPRHNFEHLDILPPALVKFGRPKVVEELFGPTIRGDILWCQGFSEPTAGSDLAALRTKAVRVDGGYRVDGHKIWTSWAKWATHCLFLARTGTPEDRHRGLSAFVVPLDTPGLQVGVIRQSNGTEELAEVFFDGMIVPEEGRLGEEGEGWAVAMHILAGERGSYAWLRQSEMLPKLERLSQKPRAAEYAGMLGESLTRLLALRCRSREVLEILHRGEEPGPESSVSKVLVIDSEQHFYDVAREILAPDLDLGIGDDIEAWQESYLYSRASSIYGGSRQIQLNVIAKLMVSQGKSPRSEASDDEAAAIRESVIDALEKAESPREALDGLDWWSYGTTPSDSFGRAAFAAGFEGQGSAPARSPALAAVRAGGWAAASPWTSAAMRRDACSSWASTIKRSGSPARRPPARSTSIRWATLVRLRTRWIRSSCSGSPSMARASRSRPVPTTMAASARSLASPAPTRSSGPHSPCSTALSSTPTNGSNSASRLRASRRSSTCSQSRRSTWRPSPPSATQLWRSGVPPAKKTSRWPAWPRPSQAASGAPSPSALSNVSAPSASPTSIPIISTAIGSTRPLRIRPCAPCRAGRGIDPDGQGAARHRCLA